MLNFDPLFLIPFIFVLLPALTLHEFGHAWTADHFGDPTPKQAGRLTLDPLKHLDPLGTIFLFIAHVGWAKPVPVNPANFNHPRADLWVSLAGIIANLIQAIAYALVWRALSPLPATSFGQGLATLLYLGILINLSLALFNLLPIFPLDGSHVVKNLLPLEQSYRFSLFSERYGAAILLGLLMIGYVSDFSPLNVLIGVPCNWLVSLLLYGM
jgi:Zn-dependent protease